MIDDYFNEKEAKNTLSIVLGLMKQALNENKISEPELYEILNLLTYYYGDIINIKECERFLFTKYTTKEHIIYPTEDNKLIKSLTILLLIAFFGAFPEKVDKLLEREVLKILIAYTRGNATKNDILEFIDIILVRLGQQHLDQNFILKLTLFKNINELELKAQAFFNKKGIEEPQSFTKKNLLETFFIDFIQKKRILNFPIEELRKRLEVLESELDGTSEMTKLKTRMEYVRKEVNRIQKEFQEKLNRKNDES